MKKLFEELVCTYTQQGDYYLPDIILPEQPEYEIGVWDWRMGSVPQTISKGASSCSLQLKEA